VHLQSLELAGGGDREDDGREHQHKNNWQQQCDVSWDDEGNSKGV
jgi:hypothetical protein